MGYSSRLDKGIILPMKKILAIMLILFSTTVGSATIYRNTGPDDILLSCNLPTTRTDNTVLPISELSEIRWYVLHSAADPLPAAPYYIDTGLACRGVITLSDIADGDHVVVATAKDVFGLESGVSVGVPFTLASQSKPKAPTSLQMTRAGVVVAP